MSKIKILQIIAQKPYGTGSGVYAKELIKEISKKGYTQGIIYGEDQNPYNWNESKFNVKEYKVEFDSVELPFPILGMSDIMPYKSKKYSTVTEGEISKFTDAFKKAIIQSDRDLEPDLVICHHAYYLSALAIDLLPHRNVVVVCHGTCLRQLKSHKLKDFYIKENIKKARKVYALHESQKNKIISLFDLDYEKVEVLGIGYNRDLFFNENKNHKNNIVYVGKLSPSKGIEYLIDAMKYTNKGYHLQIVGDGNNRIFIDKLKEKGTSINEGTKNKIRFYGRLDQCELSQIFRQGEIFVLPSFYEGLPLTVVEAISCGLKVIFSQIEGPKQWLNENIKNATIDFIKLPGELDDTGKANFDEVEFSKSIAKAIEISSKSKYKLVDSDLEKLSWSSLCDRLVKNI